MTPIFSNRLALVMNSAFITVMDEEKRERFVNRVVKKDNFSDLSDSDQKLILEAEKSLKNRESAWDLLGGLE